MAALTTLLIVQVLVKIVTGFGDVEVPPLTVYHGTEAREGMFPSIGWVFLLDYDFTSFRCGATLIDGEWAVSAAHCFCNQTTGKPKNFFLANVIFGDVDYTVRTEWHQESSFDYIIHEEYNSSSLQNDIALLHLKQKLKMTEYVRPEKMATPSSDADLYENCQVAGWGYKDENVETTKLLYANLSLTENSRCEEEWINFDESTMLCAGSSDACVGDSGGPLYCDGELVGIVSFGISTCKPSEVGVYTSVSAYNDWIRSKTRNLLLWIVLPCAVVFGFIVISILVIIVVCIRRKAEQNDYESMHDRSNRSGYLRIP